MQRGEAVCHAVALGLAFVATAASLAATMTRGEVGALALIALASGVLMVTIGRRFWRTLRGQHAGHAVGVTVSAVSTLAAIAALGWAAWAARTDPHAAASTAFGSGPGIVLLAVTVLMALAAQMVLWNPLRAGDRRRQTAAIVAVLALTSALGEVFLCLVSGSALDTVPLLIALTFSALSLHLICSAGNDTWPANVFTLPAHHDAPARGSSGASGFVLLALIVLGFLGGTGYYYVSREMALARDAANADLAAIAGLKARSIADWYGSHLATANLLLAPATERDVFAKALTDGDEIVAADSDHLLRWMRSLMDAGGYAAVAIYDPHGRLRLSVGATPQNDEALGERIRSTVSAHSVQVDDMRRDPGSNAIAIDFRVPLRLSSAGSVLADGVLLLRLDPAQYLYPMVQTWPTTSASAETLLVRRDGDSVLFLNELRHRSGTALRMRLPLHGRTAIPALIAVTGEARVAEGADYRGEPVLAAVRSVPGTPWFLIAKTDRSEIYAPVRTRIGLLSALIAVVGLAALLGAVILWRQRSYAQLWRELELQRANAINEQRYRRLVENISDALMIDDVQGHAVYVNDRFLAMYGYQRDEVIGEHFSTFCAPPWRESGTHRHRQRVAGEAVASTFEYQALRKDGSLFWAEVHVSTVVEDGRLIGTQATVQDISERKRAQELQAALLHISEAAHAAIDMDDLYRRIHQIISTLLPAQNFYVALYDEVTDIVSFPWFIDAHDPQPAPQKLDEISLTAVVLRSGEAILLHPASPSDAQRFGGVMVGTTPVEWLGVPMHSQARTIGVLAVQSYDPAVRFSESDKALLQFVSTQVAAAIERAQHQADQRLAKVVFEQTVEAIVVSDQHDRIVMVNPAFESLTGYAAAEVIGKNPKLLQSTRHEPGFYQRIEESVAREDWWQGEFWCRHRAGENRPMLLSVVAVRDGAGEIIQRIRVMSDISEQKFQAARIEQLAFYDSLTGLPNRALFLDRLEHSLDAARRHGLKGALLFLDLDRFKEINDSQGHAVGDLALVEVARRFQRLLRKEETLARLGGDEFVLIAEGANQDSAATIAERMLGALRAPMQVSDQATHLSGSIGVALYPDDGDSVGDLIKHADIAMYRAKAMGGGFRFYQAAMGAALQERLGLARRLELAIEQGLLYLHYQPRVALASETLHGAEALLRWHDAEFGEVPPDQFIPIAEERGLIGPLGDWVITETCRQMAQWQAQGLAFPGTVAINLSALQLHLPDMVDKLLARIDAAGLSTDRFEIELTESSMMADPAAAIDILDQLHGAGFSLAIDDFGTGYSSLVYLKRFAVDNIKIDMSFVSDMLVDRNDAAIVATIVAMSRSLGLRTTAEGVESAEQAEALLQLGCDFAQGYHFGRPEPADIFARRWLKPVVEKTSGAL